MFQKSDKKVVIEISDSNGTQLYEGALELEGVSAVNASVDWINKSEIKISLFESGSADIPDERSQALARSGPVLLQEIELEFLGTNFVAK